VTVWSSVQGVLLIVYKIIISELILNGKRPYNLIHQGRSEVTLGLIKHHEDAWGIGVKALPFLISE
jgi:hypothetical protein